MNKCEQCTSCQDHNTENCQDGSNYLDYKGSNYRKQLLCNNFKPIPYIRENLTLSYKYAVEKISQLVDTKHIKDAFAGSTVLAHLYELEKETTLEDLCDFRASGS